MPTETQTPKGLKLSYPTEWEILSAMNKLAKGSDDFKSIQLQDICKAAHMSKPTFYRRFESKEAALQWHIDQIARISLTRIGQDMTCAEGIEPMLGYVLEFRDIYRLLGKTEKDNPMLLGNYTEQVFCSAIFNTLSRSKRVALTRELEFEVHALFDVLHGAFERWRRSGLVESPHEIARMCVFSAPVDLVTLLDY